MTDQVKLKSKDGQATYECTEKYAVALVASGKWIRVTEPPKQSNPGATS